MTSTSTSTDFTPTCAFVCYTFCIPREKGCDGGPLTPISVGEERTYCGIALSSVGSYGTECYRCVACEYRVELRENMIGGGVDEEGCETDEDGVACFLVYEGQKSEEECMRLMQEEPDQKESILCEYSAEYMAGGEPSETTFFQYQKKDE